MRRRAPRTPYERLMEVAAEAYDEEDYEMYEQLIERGTGMTGKPSWQVEDDVTDWRLGLGD